VFDFDGITVYHTGDTAHRPEEFKAAVALKPDILLPCINGAFGNMNATEAALLTELAAPRVVIPTHFWMFVEQNGNPAQFLQLCKERAPKTQALLLKPGEEFIFDKAAQ
jgi:L-ascorbate 6-phosphate lactonase